MSTPMADTPQRRRARRRFDDDFKAQAVRLVLDEGKSVGAVARDLDLTETALRAWVHRARANRTKGRTGLTTAEREELSQLRKENRQLRLEREILKTRRPSSRKSQRHVRADSGEEGDLSHCDHVPGAGDLGQRVLRVVPTIRIGPRPARSTAARLGARLVRREHAAVRQPAHSRRSARAEGPREPQARDSADAGGRTAGPGNASNARR
jgi:transposase